MKKLTIALIVAFAVVAGTVVFSPLYDRPAKADAGAGIDISQIMTNAKDLPAAHHEDYSVVFN